MSKLKICVGGFIMKDNRFLFGKRSLKKKWAPGMWDIVGGHAKPGEDLFIALKRETYEETGLLIQDAELLTVTDVWDANDKEYFNYHIYMITAWKGIPTNCTYEHTEIAWLSLDELARLPLALPFYPMLMEKWITSQKALV